MVPPSVEGALVVLEVSLSVLTPVANLNAGVGDAYGSLNQTAPYSSANVSAISFTSVTSAIAPLD